MKKIIWYLHHYAGTPTLGMAYRPYYLSQEFNRAGHKAYVIAASFHHLLQHPPVCEPAFALQPYDDVNYIWLKTNTYHGNGIGRLCNMLGYQQQLRRHWQQLIALTGTPDVIIASSPHLFHIPLAHRIAQHTKATFIVEIRDLWPRSLIELLGVHPWHPLVKWFESLENYAYRHADKIVSLLNGAKPYLLSKGMAAEKFYCIPNGIELESAAREVDIQLPPALATQLQTLKTQQIKILGYAGAHGKPNALAQLLTALSQLQANHIPVHAILIGDGAEKDTLRNQAATLNLRNISFFPTIPQSQLPLFFDATDMLFIGWQNKPLYQYGISPNKLFEYLFAKKPIIHATNTPANIVEQAQCGLTVPPEQPLALAQAIQTLATLPCEQLLQMGERGYTYVIENHNYAKLANDYMRLFVA